MESRFRSVGLRHLNSRIILLIDIHRQLCRRDRYQPVCFTLMAQDNALVRRKSLYIIGSVFLVRSPRKKSLFSPFSCDEQSIIILRGTVLVKTKSDQPQISLPVNPSNNDAQIMETIVSLFFRLIAIVAAVLWRIHYKWEVKLSQRKFNPFWTFS